MSLTPRQLFAYNELNAKLDRIECANNLWVTATGAQCNDETINKHLKDLVG